MKSYIEIENPCSENWNNMKPNQHGRFCLSCQKTVIDFTNKSPSEISDILKNHTNEMPCGNVNAWDVKTNNKLDIFLWKLNMKDFRYLAIVLFSLLLVIGCRTKKGLRGKINTKAHKHKVMGRIITTPTF
jgi:hypothetical protein